MDPEDLLDGCEGFHWDAGNWDKNWRRHRVAAYECEQVFFNRPLVIQKEGNAGQREERYYTLGQTDEARWLFISFTVRNEWIRIISARDMTARERKVYQSR